MTAPQPDDRDLASGREQLAAAERLHSAGSAYCDCARGVDHESDDPEADNAWDLGGPMGLARLYSERKDAQIKHLQADLAHARDRLARIAEAHSKRVDSSGGTWGDCAECCWSWPCPTHVWATTERDPLTDPWIPADDEGGRR